MKRYDEVKDFQPEVIKAFKARGWKCEKYPGGGQPDLIATKHPYGVWVETKVIKTDSSKPRTIDHFTHAQIPTYLDDCKERVMSGIYIALAFVTDSPVNRRIIEYKLIFLRDKIDVLGLKDSDIHQLRLAAFGCNSPQDLVDQIISRRFL